MFNDYRISRRAELSPLFHAAPAMKRFAPRLIDREVVPATRRLIVHAIDFDIGVVAIQKRADRPMPNEKHMAFVTSAQHGLGFAHDTPLGVAGPFPSTNAQVWMSKELVGNGFEFLWRKKTSGRAIILVHCFPDFDRYAKSARNRFRRFQRLPLCACYDLRCSAQPTRRDHGRHT